MVPSEVRERLEQDYAPSHLRLPTGTNILIDYSREIPTVSCRIQVGRPGLGSNGC